MDIASYTVTASNGIATTAWGVADLLRTFAWFTREYGRPTITIHTR